MSEMQSTDVLLYSAIMSHQMDGPVNRKFSDRDVAAIPHEIMKKLQTGRDEHVIGVNSTGLQLLQGWPNTPGMQAVQVFELNRNEDEYFSPYIQLCVAACIHNARRVLYLKLNRDTSVHGLTKGALTYVQGHCDFDAEFKKTVYASWDMLPKDSGISCVADIIRKCKEECYREIMEEIKIEDYYTNLKLMEEIRDRLFNFRPEDICHPIYVNLPGTPKRHLCMLFDIDMSNTSFDDNYDDIISNEPEKHSVTVSTFEDLENLPRIELIDLWVTASMPLLSFYRKTFMRRDVSSVTGKRAF